MPSVTDHDPDYYKMMSSSTSGTSSAGGYETDDGDIVSSDSVEDVFHNNVGHRSTKPGCTLSKKKIRKEDGNNQVDPGVFHQYHYNNAPSGSDSLGGHKIDSRDNSLERRD